LLPACQLAQPVVFGEGFVSLGSFETELLVLPLQLLDPFEQHAPGNNAIDRLVRHRLDGSGQAEQGQEQAADDQFYSCASLAWQAQQQ
jgi:hypothetical protein